MAKNVRYNVRNIDFFHIFYFYWRDENLRYTLNFDIQSFRYIEVPLYKDSVSYTHLTLPTNREV